MHYEIDENNYITKVFFGCTSDDSTEYTGDLPSGYTELTDWMENEDIRAWYISNGNLLKDNAKAAELEKQDETDYESNRHVCNNELQPIRDAIKVISTEYPYKSKTVSGKTITISDAMAVQPIIKITNIVPYEFSQIDLIVSGKNLLPNTATSKTISGITFTQNENRSITIDGTATANIEYDIAGTSTNTNPFFVFKNGLSYYLTTGGYTFKMYDYDGSDRTEVYSGTGGLISFNSDETITQVVLSIASGATFNNITIYPQLEYGNTASTYERYQGKKVTIDYSNHIEDGLFPANNLYPSDTLYPAGTTIAYILLEGTFVTALINDEEVLLNDVSLALFEGTNNIYTIQDTYLEVTYYAEGIGIDGQYLIEEINATAANVTINADKTSLNGKEIDLTSDNITINSTNFSVDEDGNMVANSGKIAGWDINSAFLGKTFGDYSFEMRTDRVASSPALLVWDNANNQYNFYIRPDGVLYARYASISGDITSSNATITGGELNIISNKGDAKMVLSSSAGGRSHYHGKGFIINSNNNEYPNYSTDNLIIGDVYSDGASMLFHSSDYGQIDIEARQGACGIYLNGVETMIEPDKITTPQVIQTSKAENKKNFEKLKNALDIVKNTDIYKYNFKDEKDTDKKHIGFVIGDDYNYAEELTSKDNNGADIYSLASVCLKAIQEQQEQIESLKEEIKKLKGGN